MKRTLLDYTSTDSDIPSNLTDLLTSERQLDSSEGSRGSFTKLVPSSISKKRSTSVEQMHINVQQVHTVTSINTAHNSKVSVPEIIVSPGP